MTNNLKEFLTELNELTKKHAIEIGSCGCCNSPYLLRLGEEFQVIADTLKFNRETKEYSVDANPQSYYQFDGIMYNAQGNDCENTLDSWKITSSKELTE